MENFKQFVADKIMANSIRFLGGFLGTEKPLACAAKVKKGFRKGDSNANGSSNRQKLSQIFQALTRHRLQI